MYSMYQRIFNETNKLIYYLYAVITKTPMYITISTKGILKSYSIRTSHFRYFLFLVWNVLDNDHSNVFPQRFYFYCRIAHGLLCSDKNDSPISNAGYLLFFDCIVEIHSKTINSFNQKLFEIHFKIYCFTKFLNKLRKLIRKSKKNHTSKSHTDKRLTYCSCIKLQFPFTYFELKRNMLGNRLFTNGITDTQLSHSQTTQPLTGFCLSFCLSR